MRSARRGRLVVGCLVMLALGLVAEGSARLAFANKGRLVGVLPMITSSLHDYQERDPVHPATWRLRAGFVKTFGETMTTAGRGGHAADEPFIRINRDGFRGPEIDRTAPHPRILTIGDSCTFGTIESFSYPRVLERELRRQGSADVEVVNAGVEGYSPRDALYQIERYLALRPAIVTIYIGWGSLYNEAHALDRLPGWARLDSVRLMARGVARLRAADQDRRPALARGQVAVAPLMRPDPHAPELVRLDRFVPTFMGDVEEMVRRFRAAGSTVVLVTLPGLYTFDAPPTAKGLQIGNLPAFTSNPYVLARMADRYNAALRALARTERLPIVDLDAWSRTALLPRDAYFVNSVHLSERGQEMAGRYMAEALAPTLNSLIERSGG